MKKWNQFVTVAPESVSLFSLWGQGGKCSGCGKYHIGVKAYVDPKGTAYLAERNIPGVKYGTIFKHLPEHDCS